MSPTYVVGYDASPPSFSALEFVRGLARGTGADVIAAHIYPSVTWLYASPVATVPVEAYTAAEDEGAAAAERLLHDIAGDVEARAFAGSSVPRELHALARSEHAALLAVGAPHRGTAGRAALGSVADRVVHGSPCPVVVVPQAGDTPRLEMIAVAYDGRLESRRALRLAEALALRVGAALRLVSVIDLGPAPIYVRTPLPPVAEPLEAQRAEQLDEVAGRLRRRGLEVETQVVRAPAGPAIAQACAHGVDLLVCGSRGYGPLRSVMLGGVSRHLVDHGRCPVMVLPRGASVAAFTEPLEAALGA